MFLLDNSETLRSLDSDAFIERLHALYGAVPDAIRQSAEWQEIFLPILRADVTLLETYHHSVAGQLDCAITVLSGVGYQAITIVFLWLEFGLTKKFLNYKLKVPYGNQHVCSA